MLSFKLTEEQEMIRQMARNFAKKEILPAAEHYDQSDEFPWPIIRKAQKTGLISSNVPEAYGGPGLGVLEECIINEELAWACSGVQTVIMLNNLAAWPIILAGSADQKERYLPRLTDGGQLAAYALTEPAAGSDVAGILSTAVRQGDEYVLNGTKTWITNAPVASFFIIFAKTDPEAKHRGISAFIVERDWPGVTCGKPIPKMGQHAAWTGEIVMEDVRVPAENRLGNDGDGFLIAMKVFDRSRPPWRPQPWASRVGRWTRPPAMPWSARHSASRLRRCRPSVSCWRTWRSMSRQRSISYVTRPGWWITASQTSRKRRWPRPLRPTCA